MFSLKIDITSLAFTFFLHINTLNTRLKSSYSLFDIFPKLTKV